MPNTNHNDDRGFLEQNNFQRDKHGFDYYRPNQNRPGDRTMPHPYPPESQMRHLDRLERRQPLPILDVIPVGRRPDKYDF